MIKFTCLLKTENYICSKQLIVESHPAISFDDTSIAFAGKTNSQLKAQYRLFRLMNNAALVKLGTKMAMLAMRTGMPVNGLIKATIFKQFCGGESLRETIRVSETLGNYNIKSILDYGVEGKETEAEFEKTKTQLLNTLQFAKGNPNIPFISCKVTGLTRFALLEKLQSGELLTTQEQKEKEQLYARMHAIAQSAQEAGVGLFVDAEESWIQEPIDEMVFELMRSYNKTKAVVYSTPQMYRHDRLAFCKKSLEDAKQNNYILGLKPVRGAYMEKERKRAAEKNYPSPIQPDKISTDKDYNAVIIFSLENADRIALCAATHNEESSLLLANEMDKRGIKRDNDHFWFSQLYGMNDQITYNLAKAGFNVTKYLPYGPVKDVIPYLMRRAQENTSVTGQMSRELRLIHKEIKRRDI